MFDMDLSMWNVSKYRVFYGPYFPAFGLNIFVSLRIQSECGKIGRPEKTPYLDTFHAVKYAIEETTNWWNLQVN